MDVIFEIPGVREFPIELWFFDTVLAMKERIQKYEGIPNAQQTLIFNGRAMEDDRDTEFYEVLNGSRIHLLVQSEPINNQEPPPKIQLTVKIPSSNRNFSVDVNLTDTVLQLKERVHEMEGIASSQFVLFMAGNEMQEQLSLAEYSISNHSEVSLILKSIATSSAGPPPVKKLKVMVLAKCGTKKIPVEMNASDKVGELRKELQRLHQHHQFHLPQEGYFFIFKQNVMEDDRTFRWHDVRHGDTIEIFNGSVTGGS